ncbi:MAG: TonB-dependent receptor [Proteobacteria bacterium]|nr:TonB-dependent receptor [Pseudomonadota bacterium]
MIYPATLLAQSDSQSGSDVSTVTYPAAYFAQFAPVSVTDMLDRIPGINLVLDTTQGQLRDDGGTDRGLGGSSQILIDGKRIAGKENEARSQLSRLAAAEVNYIEIVRGTSSSLDVQNTGQLINIVLHEALSRSSISAEVGVRHFQDGTLKPEGSFAITGQQGNLNYLLSASARPGYRIEDTFELSLNPDLSFNEIVELERTVEQTNYAINANLSYDLTSRDRIAFNLLYGENDPPSSLLRRITDFGSEAPSVSFEREDNPSTAYNWEIGGDLEHSFENGAKFKFLFIVNDKQGDSTRERFEFQLPGAPESKNLFIATSSRYQEKIVRSSYTWNVVQDQGLELGVERAQTTQDSALHLGLSLPGEGSPAFGGLVPVNLPNSIATVEEIRYEGFAVHNWRINQRMSLESSLVAEYSEIEQSGDVNKQRDFDFLKPKFDYRFDFSNSLQLRLSLEKNVAQLSFADFSANANFQDEDRDTIAGNPELIQQESWRYAANLDYRLPNDGGVLNTRLFYYDIDNVIGRIDISSSSSQLESTNGNVGDGFVYGLNLDASVRFDFLGFPQAFLTAGLLIQETEIEDPMIDATRKVIPYDRGSYSLGFRQDIPGQNLNYGFNFADRFDGNRPIWDVDNVLYFGSFSNLMLFVEKTGFAGLTYRLEAINILDHAVKRERRRFASYARDGVLDEIERFSTVDGVRFTFKIRGTF